MSEILLKTIIEKLDQTDKQQQAILSCLETIKEQFSSKLIFENTKAILAFNKDLNSIQIPAEVKLSKQVTHINGGVKFMIVILVSVIICFGGFAMYHYKKYVDYERFAKSYEAYEENRKWNIGFYEFMKKKNPRDAEMYQREHPYPMRESSFKNIP